MLPWLVGSGTSAKGPSLLALPLFFGSVAVTHINIQGGKGDKIMLRIFREIQFISTFLSFDAVVTTCYSYFVVCLYCTVCILYVVNILRIFDICQLFCF